MKDRPSVRPVIHALWYIGKKKTDTSGFHMKKYVGFMKYLNPMELFFRVYKGKK